MALSDLTERLYNLRRDRTSGYEKPYKPALLLAIFDLIEKGSFSDNRVFLTDELIQRYRDYIKVVGGPRDTARIQYPFWFLCSDGIWQIFDKAGNLVYNPGDIIGSSPSIKRLRAMMSHASLEHELFEYLQRPAEQALLRSAVISRYFPGQRNLLQALHQQYLQTEPIAAEDPGKYEKDPARSQAFARTIKEVYDYRCAACGIRVRFRELALVDACHLIPFSESFNDHPTNGMALCKNHHWALDRNLISPSESDGSLIWEPSPLLDDRIEGQRPLVQLAGKRILLPRERKFYPAVKSIQWRVTRLARL